MPIDPNISLQVRSPQIKSPLDAYSKSISIMDMMSQLQERQQIQKQREQEAPLRAAVAQSQLQKLKEEQMMNTALDNSVSYDPEIGDLKYDKEKAAAFFGQNNAMHLLPEFDDQASKRLTAHRTQAIDELTNANKLLEFAATPAENFLALDEDKKKSQWPTLRSTLIRTDPTRGKILPYNYDPAVIDPKLQELVSAYQQTQDMGQKLTDAKSRAQVRELMEKEENATLSVEDLWTKVGGKGTPTPQFRNEVIAQRANVKPPAVGSYTQAVALRKLGLKLDPDTGETVPLAESELSDREKADLAYRQAGADLREAQEEAASALADARKAQTDPNSQAFKDAKRRLDIAQQNANTARGRLGIQQETLELKKSAGGGFTLAQQKSAVEKINAAIAKEFAEPGSPEAKAIWDREAAHYRALGMEIPEYDQIGPMVPLKRPTPPPPPKATGKIARKADVEAAAKKAGITFDELKKRIEAAGGKVQ